MTAVTRPFRDRHHAGQVVAGQLAGYAGRSDLLVLGLARGGVPVAAPVAWALDAPLDVLVVRKLGLPGAPEVAFGALGPAGVLVLDPELADRVGPQEVARVAAREAAELRRREQRYRAGRDTLALTGRLALIIDDGWATGATAQAALFAARQLGAMAVILAAPVGSPDALTRLHLLTGPGDEVLCPLVPADFGAVSRYYEQFEQVSDDDVARALAGR